MHVGLQHYLAVSMILFCLGLLGVILRRNLLVYGLGGLAVPFIGIKAIDLVVAALGLA